jgi:hypothetical protein
MSNKTYTAAEVEALIQAERAKSLKTASTKSVMIEKATRVTKDGNVPYTGIFVSGPFRQCYIPLSVAKAILANSAVFESAVNGSAVDRTATKESPKALSTDTAPRLAPVKS